MASLHELRDLPSARDYFLLFDDLLEVVRDASIKYTYNNNFPLVDVSELQPLPLSVCHPPLTRVPRGRPKKERFRKADVRGHRGAAAGLQLAEPAGDGDDEIWVPYYCSTCGGRGHFSSTCRRPHQ
jgi:hypothetical protein